MAKTCRITPPLCYGYDIDYLNMRNEVELVKVEIACFGQYKR